MLVLDIYSIFIMSFIRSYEVNRSDRTYCLVPCWLLFYALLPSEKEKSIILCCIRLVFKQIARLYFKQSAKCFYVFPRYRLTLSELLQSRLAQQLFILDTICWVAFIFQSLENIDFEYHSHCPHLLTVRLQPLYHRLWTNTSLYFEQSIKEV